MSDLTRKSKQLSKVLRHDPGSVGVSLDSAGWCLVSDLLTAMRLTSEDLKWIVDNNNKKRFEYNQDGTQIRASQGHSLAVDLQYQVQEPPEYLWHGTAQSAISAIRSTGLLKMSRHAVHLSVDKETAIMVGKRHGVPVALQVKSGEMHKAGFQFSVSTNGVWLVDQVPPQYIV